MFDFINKAANERKVKERREKMAGVSYDLMSMLVHNISADKYDPAVLTSMYHIVKYVETGKTQGGGK
jgi:hypothetical protein